MDVPSIILMVISGIIGLVALIIILVLKSQKKRREAFNDFALRSGFVYSKDAEVPNNKFKIFTYGHSKKAFNLIEGKRSGIKLKIFDYRYTTGGGKHSQTQTQTITIAKLNNVDLPYFSLKPEHFFHKMGKVFGIKDIKIENHPQFSEKYYLKGEDQEAVKKAFNNGVINYFEQKLSKINLEGFGDEIVYFQPNKKIEPENLDTFISDVLRVVKLFDKN